MLDPIAVHSRVPDTIVHNSILMLSTELRTLSKTPIRYSVIDIFLYKARSLIDSFLQHMNICKRMKML